MTDRELRRRAAHRLAVIGHAGEVTGNVSKACRHDGITRQAYYKWLRRHEAGGVAALRDGSSHPHWIEAGIATPWVSDEAMAPTLPNSSTPAGPSRDVAIWSPLAPSRCVAPAEHRKRTPDLTADQRVRSGL